VYWAAGFDRDVYGKEIVKHFPTQAEIEAPTRVVMTEFAKARPKPPQNRGVTT